jgi:hypothetical protein
MELYESENLYPHFFGSIVTMQTDSSPEGMSKYLVNRHEESPDY